MAERRIFDGQIAGIGTASGPYQARCPGAAHPHSLAVHPRWLRAVSPLAARLSPGVRTAGAAQGGWREYYGVTNLHRIDSATVRWDGTDAGAPPGIRPAVGFGFSSVPPEPALARVRTTVESTG